jgi:hypothetical protein
VGQSPFLSYLLFLSNKQVDGVRIGISVKTSWNGQIRRPQSARQFVGRRWRGIRAHRDEHTHDQVGEKGLNPSYALVPVFWTLRPPVDL